jgi:hypothetical protein
MIAFRNYLPLVKHRDGCVTAFQRDWLRSSLEAAAGKAGYQKWWLAEHVTESVEHYLETHITDPVVSSQTLGHAVRSVLHVIGYPEVADQFQPAPPLVDVYLTELAADAGTGYELAFFTLFGQKLDELQQRRIQHARCVGLHACVKSLSGAKAWSPSCRILRDQIVEFVRARMDASSTGMSITLI